MVGEVGVAVEPGDELGRGVRTRQVLAGYPKPVVARGAYRVDHGVVVLEQVGPLHVPAELDPSEEAQPRVCRGLLEDARDALDLRVVGGDAERTRPSGVGSASSRSTSKPSSSNCWAA